MFISLFDLSSVRYHREIYGDDGSVSRRPGYGVYEDYEESIDEEGGMDEESGMDEEGYTGYTEWDDEY